MSNGIEVNGCANSLLLLDQLETTVNSRGYLPSDGIKLFEKLRKQQMLLIKYLEQLENPRNVSWHSILKQEEK